MPAHAQLTESEPNNDFATANFLPADTVLSGVTCAAPETDYLYIVPPSDGVMRIITSISANTPSPIPNDLLIQVISDEIHHYGDGIPLVGANGVPITDTSTWTCIAADTVFFVVHNSTMFNGYCYTYEVRYEMTAPHFSADVEPNNSLAEAVELPHATDVEGHLGFITDPAYGGSDIYDYYRIVPLEDGVLRVIVESENTGVLVNPVNMHLEEFNARTFEVGLNSVPLADTLYWTCLRADTFHLRFAMPTFTDCGISYRLRYDILPGLFTMEQEPNNSIAEAVVLPLGTDQEGHLGFLLGPLNTDWYDYHHIVLPDNGDLRVIIGSENAGTVSNTVNLSLEGVFEQPIDMGVNGALFTDTLYWNCLTPGSYHLKFAMPTATDCGITYRMRCDLLAPVYANDPEPNGVIPQAVPATMGVPVDGHLQHGWLTSDNNDYFRVVKSDTGHFRIVSEAYSLQAAAQQLNLEIADHTWTPIANFTALMGSNGIVLTDTSTILNAPVDTLYIRVSMQPGACGAYRLWFTTVSTVGIAEAEQAPLLEVFPNPTDGHVRISWPEVGEGTLELHDATGRVVLQRNVRADARSIELDLSGLSLGTYACMVRNTDTRHWARIVRE